MVLHPSQVNRIKGRAVFDYWPPQKIGALKDYSHLNEIASPAPPLRDPSHLTLGSLGIYL